MGGALFRMRQCGGMCCVPQRLLGGLLFSQQPAMQRFHLRLHAAGP